MEQKQFTKTLKKLLSKLQRLEKTLVKYSLKECEKNIRVVKTLGFKVRCSVVLSMLHDGRKLRPLVIFKSKGSSSKFAAMGSTRIVVRSNMNGWITDKMMDVWFSNVYEKHNIEDHDIKYLIMDRASSHVSDSIVTRMKKENIEHSFIPAGCTSFLQPLDVYINRGFKSTLRNSFEKWYSSYAFLEKNRTVGGYLRAPDYPLYFSGFSLLGTLSLKIQW